MPKPAETLGYLPTEDLHTEWFDRTLAEQRVIEVFRDRLGGIVCSFWIPLQAHDLQSTFFKLTADVSLTESGIDPSSSSLTSLNDLFKVEVRCRTNCPAFPPVQQYVGYFTYPECLVAKQSERTEAAFSIAMRVLEAIELFKQQLVIGQANDAMPGSTSLPDVLLGIQDPEAYRRKAQKGEIKGASQDASAENYLTIAEILGRSTEDFCRPK